MLFLHKYSVNIHLSHNKQILGTVNSLLKLVSVNLLREFLSGGVKNNMNPSIDE